jgi:hypothetical protein
MIIIAAFIILIIGTMPYATSVTKEEKDLDKFIEQLKK